MGNVRILVVEDDADINEVVCTRLMKAGFSCTAAYSGSEARLLLARGADSAGARDDNGGGECGAYDCIITDLMLPGLSGERLVAMLRERGAGVPIIVISARDAVADRVSLLKLGADDYLVKPFDLDELVVRVQAQLRGRGYGQGGAVRRPSPTNATLTQTTGEAHDPATADANHAGLLTAGRWTLNPAARTFAIDDRPVSLTNTEFNIVELLMAHPNTVFTKQQVYELCWNEPYIVDDNTVTAHVSKIRAKLKPSGTDAYVRTVWGLGFKLDV
ncbi:response regulator transcription factor [Bifidobacterium biavatii]|uniref:XRE family transcriptional regulator n=1 Tax=Bifidobacterium biavatii DSM 23969 TaxID=1437608 RepID=A0A087A1W7_9BIFI|nr:response regulator transcription factor [Bifidobacterium biavatii]KFI52767.1 XRE family transcriptional regulator [Bifidobacterium biavatii DSM 23969]